MTSATFRHHFDMISMHEPPQRKAKFWTSYVKALKGTEDMRANDDASSSRRARPMSAVPDLFPRIFEQTSTPYSELAGSRINAPGYRYQPVSCETYGSTSRSFRHENTSSKLSQSSYSPRSRK